MTSPTNPNLVTPDQPDPMLSFEEREARLRTELYIQQRIDYQDNYYHKRMSEFTFNSNVMLWISAGLMGISTIISSYSVRDDQPFFAFLTALLPAFATMVAAFRSLYQWQRQATLYEDTWLALQQARLAMPDEDFIEPGDYGKHFPELVRQTESVLRNEASQWGQLDRTVTDENDDGEQPGATTPNSTPPARSIYE